MVNVVVGAGILDGHTSGGPVGLPGRVHGLVRSWTLIVLTGVALLMAGYALVSPRSPAGLTAPAARWCMWAAKELAPIALAALAGLALLGLARLPQRREAR